MSYQMTLDALSDPTRRSVLEALRRGPRPVGEIAAGLPVSRPAVSQHLKVLEGAGLVRATRQGTRRIYQVDPAGLLALREWVEGFWDDVLEAFKDAAERPARTAPAAAARRGRRRGREREEQKR